MRYLVDITQKQAAEISKLISEKRYENIQQFINTAIDNQIYIEETDIAQQPVHNQNKPVNNIVTIKEKEHDDLGYLVTDVDIRPSLTEIKNQTKTLPMPKFEELAYSIKRGKVLDEGYAWLWGQINRIFPIKLGLRVLLIMSGNDAGIELDTFLNKAANVAIAYGKMLRSHEQYAKKLRDARGSVGLPLDISNDEFREAAIIKLRESKRINELEAYLKQEEFKSANRYRSQFLALVRKDGKLDGAMPSLKFTNLKKTENGKTHIGLTKAGLEFAKLKNPIIDNKKFDKSLGDKEIDFYLDHISKNVKAECKAIRWLLGKIEDGITERDKINQELKNDFNDVWNYSDKVINTQRSGLMARMFELGLIDKEKSGVTVQYNISKKGKEFLFKG